MYFIETSWKDIQHSNYKYWPLFLKSILLEGLDGGHPEYIPCSLIPTRSYMHFPLKVRFSTLSWAIPFLLGCWTIMEEL